MEKNLRDIRDALGRHGVEFRTVEEGRAAVVFTDKDARAAPPPRAESDADE